MTWDQAVEIVTHISGEIIEDAKAGKPFVFCPDLRANDPDGLATAAAITARRIMEAWGQPWPDGVTLDDIRGLCYMMGALWQHYSIRRERARKLIEAMQEPNA